MARIEIYNYHPIFTQFPASLAGSSFRASPIAGPAARQSRAEATTLALSVTTRTVAGELTENGPRLNLPLSPHLYSASRQYGSVNLHGGPDCRSVAPSASLRF